MKWLERLKSYRVLRKHAIPDHDWLGVTHQLPLLMSLSATEKVRLRVLATLFLHKKYFTGVQGMVVTPRVKIIIAAQACLEILNLGIGAYDGWYEIIVYPGAFRVTRERQNDIGLVDKESRDLSGESWMQGPVILSWDDIERDSFTLQQGRNVIIHEFAHKLDMLNGRANGMPPLHPDMRLDKWTDSLSEAYEQLIQHVHHHHGDITPYAASNPAEFFAVMCEYFFTSPDFLHEHYPRVYRQLSAYFRQDPVHKVNG